MKEMDSKLFVTRIIEVILGLIIVFMPFAPTFLYQGLVYFAGIWLISFGLTKQLRLNKDFLKFKYLILPIFGLIGLCSLLYTTDSAHGIKILERHSSFLFLPYFFYVISGKILIKRQHVVLLLGISVLLSFIYSVVSIVFNEAFPEILTSSNNIYDVSQQLRSNNLFIQHPTYLTYFLLIYFIIGFNLFKVLPKSHKWGHAIVISFALFWVFMLGSRAGNLTVVILFLYAIFKAGYTKKYILLSVFFIVLSVSIFMLFKYSRFQSNINLTEIEKSSHKKETRIIIWENALALIKEKPLQGYGIGDVRTELLDQFQRTNFVLGVEKHFNAHNQFLETYLQSGLIGFLVLLTLLLVPLIRAIKRRQEALFLFILISIIQLFFESYFQRFYGVLYFSLFYGYFLILFYKQVTCHLDN